MVMGKQLLMLLSLFIGIASYAAPVTVGSDSQSQTTQVQTATGVVKDALGPIVGAGVVVKGTHNGTITNENGQFTLTGVPSGAVLEITCIGYASQDVVWNGQPLSIVLEEDSEMLEGTVVTALGIRKDEKKVGYAVSTVNAEKLNATVAPSLGSALYGKASGVRISTAPGGATGAISINVRGLSSITGTNQPLVIVDGVPIRNGEANNSDYWGIQRMQTNGLADINVEDIENLSILKGASATSLYGSEGANGVVLITMKQGKKNSGTHIDFNASLQGDFVAYMPQYQTVYGPGYPYEFWSYASLDDDPTSANYGFRKNPHEDRSGNKTTEVQNSYYYFGPKYDGRTVYTPTGYRAFSPITENPWSDLFRTAITQQYNIAVTSGNEKGNFRFSYTFMDNLPNQYNSHLGKHNFAVSGSQDITANGAVKLGYSVNYMNQSVKNRPYRIARLVANYGGMFGAFDDIAAYRDRTVTSAGYKNRAYTSASHENPAEGWEYGPAVSALIDEYLWNIEGREQFETNQRLIASVTPSWQIIKGLTLKGSIATDYTNQDIELKEHAETAMALGGNGGYYAINKNTYTTVYGDAMLTYDTKLTEDLGLTTVLGYSAREEKAFNLSSNTRNGLSVENWFHLKASNDDARTSESFSDLLKQAVFATASLSYKDWAYLEGTIRNEKISTLAPGNNSFWYPSVNGSIIFSELFNLPKWIDYGKVRASYGVVGNAPAIYRAASAYSHGAASGYIYDQLSADLGNDSIRPETTHEWEFGLESKFLNNRFGFELSYYTKNIVDQILQATAPRSAGGSSMLMNVGILKNQGLEFSLYGTVIENKDWRLDLSGNIAWNRNEVRQLANGLDRLQHARWDNGAVYVYSDVGRKMGDIYAFAPAEDKNGNKIVTSEGYYKLTDEPVLVGNAMPDLIGGFAISLGYKRVTLDANFNFQVGGAVWNQPYQYMMGLGAIKESLPYRGTEYGGMAFYTDANTGQNVAYTGSGVQGPNGETVHYDGVILPGVKEDGSPNDIIIGQELILEETYAWGVGAPIYYSHSVFDNTYVKCREITLTYALPDRLIRKFRCSNLRISAFARNPFFIYKNLPIFDAEAMDATSWISQIQIGGSTSTSRTFGLSLRANF